jgi:hypothetical protein
VPGAPPALISDTSATRGTVPSQQSSCLGDSAGVCWWSGCVSVGLWYDVALFRRSDGRGGAAGVGVMCSSCHFDVPDVLDVLTNRYGRRCAREGHRTARAVILGNMVVLTVRRVWAGCMLAGRFVSREVG